LDDSQRRELSDGMFHRSSGSFELVLAPLLLGLLGLWIDRRLDTAPVLTITFAVVGVVGAVVKTYYEYRHGMAMVHAADAARRDSGQA
jgi:F0F1-type ATP synthase assembly protein I